VKTAMKNFPRSVENYAVNSTKRSPEKGVGCSDRELKQSPLGHLVPLIYPKMSTTNLPICYRCTTARGQRREELCQRTGAVALASKSCLLCQHVLMPLLHKPRKSKTGKSSCAWKTLIFRFPLLSLPIFFFAISGDFSCRHFASPSRIPSD